MMVERARKRTRSLPENGKYQSLPSRRSDINQRSEETMIHSRRSSSKEKRSQRPVGTSAMTELKCPKPIDLDRLSGSRMKQADGFKLTNLSQLVRIESMNTSISEVANE